MEQTFTTKSKYNMQDLLEIMRILRGEHGCPWDREQTHDSIRKNLIEETYEAIEAINKHDDVLLCEELGDVLMQVVFHAQMAAERDAFTFDDVADGICKKLIERHPHVFGDVQVASSGEVLENWEQIKSATKHRKTVSDKMQAVPRELPALMRAYKIQEKAAKVGFDWDDLNGALQKLPEETAELRAAYEKNDRENALEELGDLLFSVVNAARFLKLDPEEALTAATDKFQARFCEVEKLAEARGVDMQTASLASLDALWNEVKKHGSE